MPKLIFKTIILVIICSMSWGCSSFKPKELGIKDGKLYPCPPAPKCVSSYYKSGIHHVSPIAYSGSKEEAYQKIISIINNIEKSSIVKTEANYILASFEVTKIKWIDYTEFLFDEEKNIIHYSSSASAKIGFWDWGENKRRALKIKKLFEEK